MKALAKWLAVRFAPYQVEFMDGYEPTEFHYSWTYKDAVEWAACALRDEDVGIFNRYAHDYVGWRHSVVEL